MKIYSVCLLLFSLTFHMLCQGKSAQDSVKIYGKIKGLRNGDSVKLIRYQYQFLLPAIENQIISYAKVENNSFAFTTQLAQKVEKCQIIFPENLSRYNWIDGILPAHGDVKISVNNSKLHFTGNGSNLVAYKDSLDSIYRDAAASIDWQGDSMQKNTNIIEAGIEAIENVESYNENKAFSIIRLDKTVSLLSILYTIATRTTESAKEYVRRVDAVLYKKYLKDIFNNNDITNIVSPSLIGLVRTRFLCLHAGGKDNQSNVSNTDKLYLEYLKRNYKEPLVAQLVASFLYTNRQKEIIASNYFNDILKSIDFSKYEKLLQGIKQFSAGNRFPDFSLLDTTGKQVFLSQFRGNVLILDFWFTGCGACAISHKIVAPIIKKLDGFPVKLISISEDKIKTTWLKSVRSELYSSASDINLSAGSQGEEHPLFRYFQISAYPTFIIIDKEGKIIGSPISPNNDNGADLERKVMALIGSNSGNNF